MPLLRPLFALESRLRRQYDVAPVDAESRRKARIFNFWFDHAPVRLLWTNEDEIAPGVWRSNQPGRGRFRRLALRGFRSVLTLRGEKSPAVTGSEAAWCREFGLDFHSLHMSDRRAPPAETLLALLATMRRLEKPLLIHCKAGADRTGLAAVLYLMAVEGRTLAEARPQLSFRYFHVRGSKAGVLDLVLDTYARDAAEAGGEDALPIETWLATRYDAEAVQAAFRAG